MSLFIFSDSMNMGGTAINQGVVKKFKKRKLREEMIFLKVSVPKTNAVHSSCIPTIGYVHGLQHKSMLLLRIKLCRCDKSPIKDAAAALGCPYVSQLYPGSKAEPKEIIFTVKM